VKIWTEESPGLRRDLPEEPVAPGSPCASDTRNDFMSVAFERNDKAGQTSPLRTVVEINSMDFEALAGTRFIELRHGVDSPTLVFPLRVIAQGAIGYVQVRVKTKSLNADYWIENGSLSCQVRIRRVPVLSRILSLFSTSPRGATRLVEARKACVETDLIADAERQFQKIIDDARSGPASAFIEIHKRMRELHHRLSDIRQRVTFPGARDRLSVLCDDVQKCYRELENIREKIEDAQMIDPLYKECNSLLERINSSRGIKTTQELETYRSLFQRLHMQGMDALRSAKSIEGKHALRRLLERLYSILRELGD